MTDRNLKIRRKFQKTFDHIHISLGTSTVDCSFSTSSGINLYNKTMLYKKSIGYVCLLYVAWANQRHRQCFIRYTEQFLTELCCMTDSKARAAESSLFQGLASSPAREATRRATKRFCKLFQPARERENRPVYLDTRHVRSKPSRLA